MARVRMVGDAKRSSGVAEGATLTERTSASILWMTLQRWVTRISALVTLMVLTRALAPEDFGLAAAATTLIPILYVFADIGFSTYLVQADDIGPRTTATAFWFALGCGAVLAGAVALLAPGIGGLIGEPAAAPLIQALAVSILLVAASSVPISLLRRRMGFRSLAIGEAVAAVLAQAAAIAGALMGAGAWALVVQVLVSQFVFGVLVWVLAGWRPSGAFSVEELVRMIRFGVSVVASSLVGMARAWGETVILIGGLGLRATGFVVVAQRLVMTAQELSMSALLPVATSAFAAVQEDAARMRAAYLRATNIAYAVVVPLLVFVAVSAPVLVPFLFGDGQSESAQVVPAIAALVILNVSWAIDQGLYLGTGRPVRWLLVVAVSAAAALTALWLAAPFGLKTVLWVWVLTALVENAGRWFVVRSVIAAPARAVAARQWGILLPAALAGAAGWGILVLAAPLPAVLSLAASGITVLAVYLAATRVIRPRTFTEVVEVLPGPVARTLRWALPRPRPVEGGAR